MYDDHHDRHWPESVCAADEDVPIRYMQRTRDYYLALGYDNPYRWAHFVDVPFTPLRQPLAASRLALISTAAPYQPGVGDQGPGAAYNAAAKFYQVYSGTVDTIPDVRISHLGYDRVHTTAADMHTYFPLARLQEAVPLAALVLWRSAFTAPPRTAASA